jgi:hypothetical protein
MLLRAVVVMAAVACVLGTASSAGAGALDDCAQRVIRDWYSGGRVDKVYPLPCYRAAIRALPDDVLQYSDASVAIERALEHARHRGAPEASGATPEPHAAAPSTEADPMATTTAPHARATKPRASPSPTPDARRAHPSARLATGPVEKTAAPGIPYPLIALGTLAAVLLVSGVAAGLAHRRR